MLSAMTSGFIGESRLDITGVKRERDSAVPEIDVVRPIKDLELTRDRLPDRVRHHSG